MTMLTLKVKKLHPDARLPTKAHPGDAAFDLYALEEDDIFAGERKTVRTGVAVEIPSGHCLLVRERSGMGSLGHQTLAGVIDSGYRGEVMVVLQVSSKGPGMRIKPGYRIAQALLLPVPECEVVEVRELSDSDRGTGGFGSTGT